jgi:hypothetical protein
MASGAARLAKMAKQIGVSGVWREYRDIQELLKF